MIKKSIADLVYDILEEKNQPMHYRAITEEVMKVKKINAENPHHDVHAIMGSDHRFMKYQRGVWGLVKWKYREANLPYNLTSYCLRNGTIFLTSYLMPYFEWARDDRNAEVIFVATNGEEIKAAINYRQKLIFGFREWFQKMGLEVNDTLFIGLADEEKRKFFIIAEKETKTDLENDLSGYIFQRLREVRKPLIFSEIIESIDSHLIDQDKISEESIQKMLRQDARYVELPKDRWALTEWLNEKNQEYFHLKIAEKVNAFFSYLKNCFDLLGFQTEWNGEIVEEELFVAKALLNYKSYSLVITGLPEDYDISMVQEINWVKLRNVREAAHTDSVFLFARDFNIKELIDRASEEGVQLYPTRILDDIMNEHRSIPFSLFDLRIAFSPMHHPRNNFEKLLEIRNKQREEWILMRDILSILRAGNDANIPMDLNWLILQLRTRNKSFSNGNIDQVGVKKVIELFSHEPFGIIELSQTGSMILSFSESIGKMRTKSLLKIIMGTEEKEK